MVGFIEHFKDLVGNMVVFKVRTCFNACLTKNVLHFKGHFDVDFRPKVLKFELNYRAKHSHASTSC